MDSWQGSRVTVRPGYSQVPRWSVDPSQQGRAAHQCLVCKVHSLPIAFNTPGSIWRFWPLADSQIRTLVNYETDHLLEHIYSHTRHQSPNLNTSTRGRGTGSVLEVVRWNNWFGFKCTVCPGTGYAVLVGGSNGDGAWHNLVTIIELIDPRPYIISLPISEADLHCNLHERPSINSSKSNSNPVDLRRVVDGPA